MRTADNQLHTFAEYKQYRKNYNEISRLSGRYIKNHLKTIWHVSGLINDPRILLFGGDK